MSRVKKKMLLAGYMAMAATEGLVLSGSFRRTDEEREAAEDLRGTPSQAVSRVSTITVRAPSHDEDDDVTELSPVMHRLDCNPPWRANGVEGAVRCPEAVSVGNTASDSTAIATDAATASCNTTKSVLVNEANATGGGRLSFLAGIANGMTLLRKVEEEGKDPGKQERQAEEEAERLQQERAEQLRLWQELRRIVAKEKIELAFEDLQVVGAIARGKFASVYKADLNVQLHSKVFGARESAKRTFERLGNNLNKSGSATSLVLSSAVKVLEYKNAYPVVGGDWGNDKPTEVEYLDDTVYTDGQNGDKHQPTITSGNGSEDGKGKYQDKYEIYPPSKCLLEALREVRSLLQLRHPHIVLMQGVVMKPRLMIVMEKMQCSLADALATPPEELQVNLCSTQCRTHTELYILYYLLQYLVYVQVALTPAQRVHILTGVSRGLAFMHDRRFMHRDIKAHNVLLTCGMGGFVAKLADFGTAIGVPSTQLLSDPVGTSGYTAPEVMDGAYGLSADIFSLGILQWETLQPFDRRMDNPLCGKDPICAAYEVLA